MERDPQITKLIREGGVVPAPEGFTGRVMNLIATEPEKKAYKPLIGWGGRILIILFVRFLPTNPVPPVISIIDYYFPAALLKT